MGLYILQFPHCYIRDPRFYAMSVHMRSTSRLRGLRIHAVFAIQLCSTGHLTLLTSYNTHHLKL